MLILVENIIENNMELDSKNLKRIIRVWRRSLKRNYIQILLHFISYVYLYFGFLYIVLYAIYNICGASRPIGLFLIFSYVMLFYLIYILINHIIVRCVIGYKILIVFDILLFLSLCSIILYELEIPINLIHYYPWE